ncbi:S9 family peptidase [Paenalcaligenes sp.]|uniref:S9 family peptidase n=1 Tax=Paenalcaligenes sp. TaxID=1966342 RepID=UPI00262BBDC0|nr:S9 family peptidase [Paenalcaligenes sp.]
MNFHLVEQQDTIAPRYELRDFFQNPQRSAYALSDDGSMIGFLQPINVGHATRLNVFVQTLDQGKPVGAPKQVTYETERDVDGFFWKGPNTIVYAKDFNGDENYHVLAVDAQTGESKDLTPFEGARAGIQDDLEDDPDHLLIAHNARNPEAFDVYRVNIHTGEQQAVAQNPGNIIGWQTDHQGTVRLAIASDGLHTAVLHRRHDADEFSVIIQTDFRTDVTPQFFDKDNQKFYALSNRGRDTAALVLIDPNQPEQEQLIFENAKYDLLGAGYSRLRHVLTAAYFEADKLHYHFFDEISAIRHQRLKDLLPGYEVSLQSATRDEKTFVVAAYSDRTPGHRFIYHDETQQLHHLGEINPKLNPAHMASMRPIRFTARDGLEIHGYLTLPVGMEPRDLPVVVNPHGGPWARDSWGFNPEVQFLANRGYAVLQINFRGSTGYGRRFWEASFGQWGLSMQDDISDGVAWLLKQGVADPNRLAIYGGSYGGYATLMAICKTPDVYAAAIDYVGVSNLLTFMQTIPPYWRPLLEKMYTMVGHPEKDRERLEATSPALNAQHIKTPLFIAQGAQDPRVNKAESDQMVNALKARHVEVEYMVKENEGHGFQNEENKFEFYERMEQFLEQHLQPQSRRKTQK